MNLQAIRAIYAHEMVRFFRTLMQSFLSPVLSTSLYFVVFGAAIGSRIDQIDRDDGGQIQFQDLAGQDQCAWDIGRINDHDNRVGLVAKVALVLAAKAVDGDFFLGTRRSHAV